MSHLLYARINGLGRTELNRANTLVRKDRLGLVIAAQTVLVPTSGDPGVAAATLIERVNAGYTHLQLTLKGTWSTVFMSAKNNRYSARRQSAHDNLWPCREDAELVFSSIAALFLSSACAASLSPYAAAKCSAVQPSFCFSSITPLFLMHHTRTPPECSTTCASCYGTCCQRQCG
jgi:hypothetical protein